MYVFGCRVTVLSVSAFQFSAARATLTRDREAVPRQPSPGHRLGRVASTRSLGELAYRVGRVRALGGPVTGEGVPEDDVTAYAWLNIAAEQGQSSANEGKEHVAKYMTQSQVVKAQKLSREYWTRYVIPFQ